ncbi:hypothetical protein DRO42_06455 [Candidatus Bathyarchaeota archaeon]|nr:MAG: hypothetical protein DRO42_06455 [Candidatus Bathyarchaeota archaeon]
MRRFGPVTVGRVRGSADLRRLLPDTLVHSEVLVVKPSWYSPHPANFTDAETLRMLLEALDGRVVVTEAYSMDRQDGSMKFTVAGEAVNWRWLLKHPSWDWIREEGRWDRMRRQDRWFLDEYGFTDLFQERGVEYVNVTEEVWQGRTADPWEVKEAVEARFAPVLDERLYGYVPRRLYELRGAPFISFGKVKGIRGEFPSLTMKNLFGLIPDPLRSWWHGPGDSRLGRSIVDINKIYAALFNIHGICEAIRGATVSNPEGEVKVPWGAYSIVRNLGVVALGRPLLPLDAVLCGLIGVDPEKVSYLRLGEEVFGTYDRGLLAEAKAAAAEWFPL